MSYTPVYNWYYLDPNTNTGTVVWEDFKRWTSLETQMFEIYSLFGNGVLSGWEIEPQSNQNTIFITPGTGHIGFKSAVTTERSSVVLSIPPDTSVPSSGIKYYIYGRETSLTNIDRSIIFFSSTNQLTYITYNQQASTGEQVNPGGLIRIGEVVLKVTANGNYVIDTPTYDTRDNISLFDNLSNFIKNHVHIGGANNPSKINLYKHVTGKLSGDMIDWLDASLVTKGKIQMDRLPKFNHQDLAGVGSLSHSDIDNIILAWSLNTDHYLGDVAINNELKLVMALKHIYETIDETLINTIVYIPGITTTEWEDLDNTTALIDRENHIIYGILASSPNSNFISWNTKNEFENAINEYNISISDYPDSENSILDKVIRSENIQVNDDGVSLSKVLSVQTVKENIANSTSVENWIQISKVISNNSFGRDDGNFNLNVNFGYFMISLFKMPGTQLLQNQDWTGSSKMQFAFKLDSNTIDFSEHGDIYLFLVGAEPKQVNNSIIQFEILNFVDSSGRNNTINANSGIKIIKNGDLTDDFIFINVDLERFNHLDSVSGIGFYTTTYTGWNPNKQFSWEIQQPNYSDMVQNVEDYLKLNNPTKSISIYRYNDNIYKLNGFIKFRFNTPTLSSWDYISAIEDDPFYDGSGQQPEINIITRISNSESSLYLASSKYVQPTSQSGLYTINQNESYWIEIEVQLLSSADRLLSPTLKSIILYYTTSFENGLRSWADYSSWLDFDSIININILQNSDRIELLSYNNSQTINFIENNIVDTINNDGDIIPSMTFDGSSLPLSPIQVFFKSGSGFIHPSQLSKTDEGNYLIADSGNDRIVELDSNGNIIRIIQGNSYLGLVKRDLMVLTASYNSRLGQVAITFSQIILLTSLNLEKFALMSGDGINSINLGFSDIAIASMFGGSLQSNIFALSGNEWSEIPSLKKDSSGNILSYSPFDIGSEKQIGSTIIPGIGKSGNGSAISNNFGTILLFNLTSSIKVQVNSWSGSKTISISSNAFTGGTIGGIAPSDIKSASLPQPSAQWYDAETGSSSAVTYQAGPAVPEISFNGDYNPYVVQSDLNLSYLIPEIQVENVNININTNIYNGMPFVEYLIGNEKFYISEPRYNLPNILIRNNKSYEYPLIVDRNKFYSDLYLSTSDWLLLTDYDKNGSINQTILKDTMNRDTNILVDVDEIDIIYWDVMHPVSVIKNDDRYIIAQANKYSVFNIGIDGSVSWTILDSVINFSFGDYGSVRLLDNGNLFFASPVMNEVGELMVLTQSIVSSIQTNYGPVDAYKNNDNTLILISQKYSNGTNSRVYQIDESGNIYWEWGLGRLKLPTSISQLSNGNIVISC